MVKMFTALISYRFGAKKKKKGRSQNHIVTVVVILMLIYCDINGKNVYSAHIVSPAGNENKEGKIEDHNLQYYCVRNDVPKMIPTSASLV